MAAGVMPASINALSNVLLRAPFVSQAPSGNWKDGYQQNGCEEASVLIAASWIKGATSIDPIWAEKEIIRISKYEEKRFGTSHDTSATTTAQVFREYFKHEKVEAKLDINTGDIIKELDKGRLVLVPANGQKLKNPYYKRPGPKRHMLVIIGYDERAKEFITHDVGTKRGAYYRYNFKVLENALFDYPTGVKVPTKVIRKAMIVVEK